VFSGLGVPPNEAQSSERKTPSPISPPKKPTIKDVPNPEPTSTPISQKSIAPPASPAPAPSAPAAFDTASFPALPKPTTAAVSRQNKAERAAERMLARMQRDERQKENKVEKTVEVPKTVDVVAPTEEEITEEPVAPLSIKRQAPGKLEIPNASEIMAAEAGDASASPTTISKPGTPSRPLREAAGTPSTISRVATPVSTPAIETPVKRVTQPRTIRVLATPTPKTEVPTLPPIINELQASSPGGSKRPSRQGSIASVNIPGTPASERISDTVSITTDTVSRADSPPPGPNRVGSAPVRVKTKSQAKKDRQERAKAEEKKVVEAVTAVPVPETVVQEAIMGRKKKTKKEKIATARSTAPSTPGASRAPSPKPTPKQETPQPEKTEAVPADPPTEPGKQEAEAVSPDVVPEAVTIASAITAAPPIPEFAQEVPTEPTAPRAPSPPLQPKTPFAPASLFAELESSGQVNAEMLAFFKTLTGFNFRNEVTAADLADIKAPLPLTNEELAKLDAGEAVRRGGENGRVFSRVMVTPSHKAIRALSKELEEKYLDLEVQVNATKPPTKYTHKNMNANVASVQFLVEDILKEAAAQLLQPLDPATGTPAGPHPQAGANPEAAVYGDDALAYLNQFILPPVAPMQTNRNTQPQPNYAPQAPAVPNRITTPAMTMTAEQMNLLATQAKTLSSSLGIDSLGLASLDGSSSADHKKIKQAFHKAVQGVVQVAAGIASSIGVQQEQMLGQVGPHGQVMVGGMTEAELEREYTAKKKECERLEKQVAALMKKNRKAVGLQGA